MNVLIVEDDPLVGDAVRRALEGADFLAERVASAEEGWAALGQRTYGLAIVDLGLPGQSGLDFVRELRRLGRRFPILVATARDSLGDRQSALAAGANDYLPKPFHVSDLIARCRLLLRISTGTQPTTHRVIGGLTVDVSNRAVLTPSVSRALSEGEWRLLEYFMNHVGQIISRNTLAGILDLEPDHIDATVEALRAVLGPSVAIRAIRGLGYRFAAAPHPTAN